MHGSARIVRASRYGRWDEDRGEAHTEGRTGRLAVGDAACGQCRRVLGVSGGVRAWCATRARTAQHAYGELKARGLGALAAQHVIKKTRDAYTTLRRTCAPGTTASPARNAGSRRSPSPSCSGRMRRILTMTAAVRHDVAVPQPTHIPLNTGSTRPDSSVGVVAHANRNASRNIAQHGAGVWIARRESRAPATPLRGIWTKEPAQQPVGHYLQAWSLGPRQAEGVVTLSGLPALKSGDSRLPVVGVGDGW